MKYIECRCTSSEHVIRIHRDDDNDVYIDTQLNNFPFWQRLYHGIKYIFGYKCCYGHWEETMLNKEQQEELIEFLSTDNLKEELKAWEKASDDDLEEMLNTQDLWEK